MKLIGLCVLCLQVVAQIQTAHAADPVRIVSGGPATIQLLADVRAEMDKVAGTKVEITVNPGDIAMVSLIKGTLDGVVAPPLNEALAAAEKRGAAKQNPDDFESFPIFDNVVKVGVHPDNPVKELTRAQLEGILSGKIKTWEPITGQKMPVTVFIAKNYQTSARRLTQNYIHSDSSPVAQYVGDKDGLLRAMKRDPGAIGFFTTKEKSADLEPKYLKTDVATTTMLVIRKNCRPEMRKLYEWLKARPLMHVE